MPFGYSGNTFQTLSPGENDVSSADELHSRCRKFQHVRETVLLAALLMLAFQLTLVETMTYLKIITDTLGKNKYRTESRFREQRTDLLPKHCLKELLQHFELLSVF